MEHLFNSESCSEEKVVASDGDGEWESEGNLFYFVSFSLFSGILYLCRESSKQGSV